MDLHRDWLRYLRKLKATAIVKNLLRLNLGDKIKNKTLNMAILALFYRASDDKLNNLFEVKNNLE